MVLFKENDEQEYLSMFHIVSVVFQIILTWLNSQMQNLQVGQAGCACR